MDFKIVLKYLLVFNRQVFTYLELRNRSIHIKMMDQVAQPLLVDGIWSQQEQFNESCFCWNFWIQGPYTIDVGL